MPEYLMEKKLSVKGMHCNACVSLIGMELEDSGIKKDSYSIELDPLSQKGVITLKNITESDSEKAIDAINSFGDYQVE